MNYDYEIVDMVIRLESDYPIIDNWESKLFRMDSKECKPNVMCTIKGVEQLPIYSGKFLSKTESSRLYLDEMTIWQELINRKNGQTLFLARYRNNFSQEVEMKTHVVDLWTLNGAQPYTARIEHMWSAIDFPYQLLQHDILTVHSATIEVNGEAILFLAPSCTGKSTQARLWNEYRGAKQLNGDKSAICVKDHRAMAYGLPFSGTSGICTNYKLPIRAIVILSQAKENKVVPLKGVQALFSIMRNCFGHQGLPGCNEKVLKIVENVLCHVDVYSLACTPDEGAVQALEQQLANSRKDV